jgi:hypothetical protein
VLARVLALGAGTSATAVALEERAPGVAQIPDLE